MRASPKCIKTKLFIDKSLVSSCKVDCGGICRPATPRIQRIQIPKTFPRLPKVMPTVTEVMGGEANMDTSGEGESLQISSTSPEIPSQPSHSMVLHVKQGNWKAKSSSRSGSRSSSSRSSLPPLMDTQNFHSSLFNLRSFF